MPNWPNKLQFNLSVGAQLVQQSTEEYVSKWASRIKWANEQMSKWANKHQWSMHCIAPSPNRRPSFLSCVCAWSACPFVSLFGTLAAQINLIRHLDDNRFGTLMGETLDCGLHRNVLCCNCAKIAFEIKWMAKNITAQGHNILSKN